MPHLSLVPTIPHKRQTTDGRLLKTCRQYLLTLRHLQELRAAQIEAQAVADIVLRDRPDDPVAAALWAELWDTRAAPLSRKIEYHTCQLAELLSRIIATPATTDDGVRARLEVWRTVHDADDADRLIDSVMADFRTRRRARA